MKGLLILVQVLLLATQVDSRNLLSRIGTQTTAFYQCFKKSGFNHLMFFVEESSDGLDEDQVDGIINAKNAGLAVDLIFTPCRGRSPADEIKSLVGQLGENVVERFWAVPDNDQPFCRWQNYTSQSNCQYLQQFIQLAKTHNITVGIGASIDSWQQNFKQKTACPEIGTAPLYWFPNDEEFDSQQNFKNYHPFGGWKVPYMKMYNITTVCNKGFQVNYYV